MGGWGRDRRSCAANEQADAWSLRRGDEVLGDEVLGDEVLGDEVLGEVHLTPDGAFPWLAGRFTPRPGFAAVKELFDEQRRAQASRIIEETMTFVAPDGPVAEFWLRIDGDAAWFRYSDEPFDED